MRSHSGQAAPEYVATLALVALTLAGAAAVAKPDIAAEVVRQARTALCIVGGDVCRSADAVAAGLEPCVVRTDSRLKRTGLTVMLVRSGEEVLTGIERRSDGSVAVIEVSGNDLGAGAQLNLTLGPIGRFDGDGSVSARWRSGRTWEFPDEAALQRALARVRGRTDSWTRALRGALDGIPPTITYDSAGAGFSAEAAGALLGAAMPLDGGAMADTIGRRVGPDGTTWFLEASAVAPKLLGRGAGRERAWTVEVTERQGVARQLVVRGLRDGDVHDELIAQLDLGDPGNRAVARDLLGLRPPWTAGELGRIATIGRHLLSVGTVERRVYRESKVRERDWKIGLGPAGYDQVSEAVRRDLVDATIHTAGGRVTRRHDCLATRPAGKV